MDSSELSKTLAGIFTKRGPECIAGNHTLCKLTICSCLCHRRLSTESTPLISSKENPEPARKERTFAGVGKTVMRGSDCVAVACSHTMAKRIALALNLHKANSKGY